MRTKKLLLLSFFTLLFWAYFNQASASSLTASPTVPPPALSPIVVLDEFAPLTMGTDCNDTVTTIAAMKAEYMVGINHIKNYFLTLEASTGAWYATLIPTAGQTVNFPAGYFAPLKASSAVLTQSSIKMSNWLDVFSTKFAVFSDDFTKCAKNKNKKVQIEDALTKFFDMSAEALNVTAAMFDYASKQSQQWGVAWTAHEGQDVLMETDKFEPVLNLSNSMKEAAQLVQDNADLALAELDIITEGAPNGRGSNDRAIQLFNR